MTICFGPCEEGTLILTSKPFVHSVSESHRLVLCNFCFKRCETLQRCSACTISRYCSRQCQKDDWRLHKKECVYFKRYAPKVLTESIKLYLRLLLKSQTKETFSFVEETCSHSRRFVDLMSHIDEIKRDSERMQKFFVITEGLKRHLHVDLEEFSASDLLETFGRMMVNSFSICDEELRPVGVGIYLVSSKLDHNCRPNAVVTFQGTTLQLRATEQLTSSSEIRISYISSLSTVSERIQQLQEQYYFKCDCSGCEDTLQEQLKQSSACTSKECAGHVLWTKDGMSLHCDKCGKKDFTADYVRHRNSSTTSATKLLAMLKEVRKIQDDAGIINSCAEFMENYKGVLHPNNIDITRLLDFAFDACINLQKWREALTYGEQTLEAYEMYHPKFDPVVGIQFMKMGKICLHLESASCLKYFSRAEEILGVTHGKESQMFKDLKELQGQADCLKSTADI